jgi:hypothetical protein
VAENNPATLREHAEQCRRLATAFNDRRAIEALERTAREYDAEADRAEGKPEPPTLRA